MNLENRFHGEMLRIYWAGREIDYHARYFLQMVNQQGGLAAAQQLLLGDSPASGFVRLWEEGRLDLSVEALVLQEPWRALFTDAELAEAHRRLKQLGYEPT